MPPVGEPASDDFPAGLMLRFLIVLAGTDPLVWRRIDVPAGYSFWDLHVAIQDAMGWEDTHLHSFRVADPSSQTLSTLGIPDPDVDEDYAFLAGWKKSVIDYIDGAPQPFQYTYDFGDDWEHAVIFEGFQTVDPEDLSPICVAGGGACPPEDSGGPMRYAELLRVLRDPKHPDYKDMCAWIGGAPFDPNEFSTDDVWFDDPRDRWERMIDDGAT
jgi:hypothetical protein